MPTSLPRAMLMIRATLIAALVVLGVGPQSSFGSGAAEDAGQTGAASTNASGIASSARVTSPVAKKAPLSAEATARLYRRLEAVDKALVDLGQAEDLIRTASAEASTAARDAKGYAAVASVSAASDFFVESATAALERSSPALKVQAGAFKKLYKTAREHVIAVGTAQQIEGQIAGVKAAIGDLDALRGQVPGMEGVTAEGLDKLRSGVRAVEALNKLQKGQTTEAALTSIKAASDLVNAIGGTSTKRAVAPLRTATDLLASAHSFYASLDRIGQAVDLDTDTTMVKAGAEKRIAEAKVALAAQRASIAKQLPTPTDDPVFVRMTQPAPETYQVFRLQSTVKPIELKSVPVYRAPEIRVLPPIQVAQPLTIHQWPAPLEIEAPKKSKTDTAVEIIGAVGQAWNLYNAIRGTSQGAASTADYCINPAALTADQRWQQAFNNALATGNYSGVEGTIRGPDGRYIPWWVPCSTLPPEQRRGRR